jgi:hypothetical protein
MIPINPHNIHAGKKAPKIVNEGAPPAEQALSRVTHAMREILIG